MSEFVERPVAVTRGLGGRVLKASSARARLRATVENGQAIAVRPYGISGSTRAELRGEGLIVRTTRNSAPEGYVLAWAERIR